MTDPDGDAGPPPPSSATSRSSGSRSTASSRPSRRCSAPARPPTTAPPPNSHTCPVCLGLPGALPTINRRAVELVLATGIAIEATTPEKTRWDRKNYFYPDLPKGYQISQYDLPLASRTAGSRSRRPRARSRSGSPGPTSRRTPRSSSTRTAPDGRRVSLVDFNRSGAPLMEIVTDPDVRSAEQARRYAEELQLLLRAIGASDADMERGQMRVEANVSLRPRGTEPFGTRVEVKNMNSFRSVERAIAFEIERQAAALDAGETLTQDTRGWDEDRGETYVMRSKEDSHDYRYFPEPDLPPLRVDPAWLDEIRTRLPELPAARRARYASTFGLSAYDALVLVGEPRATELFEGVLAAGVDGVEPKAAANWVTGSWLACSGRDPEAGGPRRRSRAGRPDRPRRARRAVGDEREGGLRRARRDGRVRSRRSSSGRASGRSRTRARSARSSTRCVAANPKAVEDYRAGKPVVGFFVGQVMKATRGQANAAVVQERSRRSSDEVVRG